MEVALKVMRTEQGVTVSSKVTHAFPIHHTPSDLDISGYPEGNKGERLGLVRSAVYWLTFWRSGQN